MIIPMLTTARPQRRYDHRPEANRRSWNAPASVTLRLRPYTGLTVAVINPCECSVQ
jgi:hypothetical protein